MSEGNSNSTETETWSSKGRQQGLIDDDDDTSEVFRPPPFTSLDHRSTSWWNARHRNNAFARMAADEIPPPGQDGNCGKDAQIRVGKFRFQGEVKHFALVPPSMINSEKDLFELLHLWDLPAPNYLLETNQSEKRRDKIITKENAAGILRHVFNDQTTKHEPPTASAASPSKNRRHTHPRRQQQSRASRPNSRLGPRSFRSSPNILLSQRGVQLEAPEPTTPDGRGQEEDAEDWTWLSKYTGQPPGEVPDWTWINRYLHRKTIGVLKSIVSAADLVDGWLLCHGAPSSNEKMLEVALNSTGASPIVLVVDELDWYWSAAVQDAKTIGPQLQQEVKKEYRDKLMAVVGSMRKEDSTIALRTALQNREDYEKFIECVDLSDLLYDNLDLSHRRASVFHNPEKESSGSIWSFRRGTQTASELTLAAGGTIVDKDEMNGYGVGEWKPRFPWTRGTHFIFSAGFADFTPRLLGPCGFLCMHGGTDSSCSSPKRTGWIIRDAMDSLTACLLLDNTGAETQMYAKLIKAITVCDEQHRKDLSKAVEPARWLGLLRSPKAKIGSKSGEAGSNKDGQGLTTTQNRTSALNDYYASLHLKLRQETPKLLAAANEGHSQEGSRGLSIVTVADVLDVSDKYCSNPRLFQKIVVAVDPLQDSPDYCLKTLSDGFERAKIEAREVGSGTADLDTVESAWRLHEQLGATKRIKRFWRGFLYACYILAAFLTVLVAVLFSYDLGGENQELQWPTTVLAMIAALCVGVLNLLSADAELNKIQTAQARIVYHIFRFRMRVGKYSLNAHESSEDEPDEDETDPVHHRRGRSDVKKKNVPTNEGMGTRKRSTNVSKKMHESRTRFSQSIKDILTDLGSHDLHTKENQAHKRKAEFYAKGSKELEGMEQNQADFEDYVADQLHLTDASERCKEVAISGLIIPEDYFQLRVLPLLVFLDRHEDSLRRQTRMLQIFAMIFNGAAVVLGAAGIVEVVAIVTAAATGLFQTIKVMDLERRFEIASAAARELRALEGSWCSLGALDKQQQSAVRHLVKTCEKIAVQFQTSSAIQVDRSEVGAGSVGHDAANKLGSRPHYKPSANINV